MNGKDLSIRINRILRKWLRVAILYRFRTKLKRFKKKLPEFFIPLDKTLQKKHKAYWADLSKRIDLDYLRMYCGFSGILDYKYIPLNVYYAIVEPLLNDLNYETWYSDKNNLDQIITKTDCPASYLKNIRGVFLNGENRIISRKQAEEIFNSFTMDLIVKPTKYTAQGKGVQLIHCHDEGKKYMNNNETNFYKILDTYKQDYILQEKIIQHEEYAKFHPSSLNSVRINIYRSVKSEEIHVLSCFFKMGRFGQIVDNASTGGLWVLVNKKGKLGDFAISKEGKIWKHPDTGLPFKNNTLPFIPEVRNTAIRAAQNFPSHRVMAFDVGIDKNGKPKVLEVNLKRIGDPQYVSGPLFKSYTDEVKEFCLKNEKQADFRVIQF